MLSGASLPRLDATATTEVKVICFKFADRSVKNRTCQEWVNRLNQTVVPWWETVSQDQTKLQFVMPDYYDASHYSGTPPTPPSDGWFDVTLNADDGFFVNGINPQLMPQIIAYDIIDFSDTDAVVFIGNEITFYGQTNVPTGAIGPKLSVTQLDVPPGEGEFTDTSRAGDDNVRNVSLAVLWEGQAFASPPRAPDSVTEIIEAEAVMIHEIGHWTGMGDIYALPGSLGGSGNRWDVMGLTYFELAVAHPQAYWREALSYLASGATVALAPRGTSQSYDLTPGWRTGPGTRPVAVKVPLGSATLPFRGYVVEARLESTAAESPSAVARDRVAAESVIVSFVDETVDAFAQRSIVQTTNGLGVGDDFEDVMNGITITVDSADSNGFTVSVDSSDPNPSTQSDLEITPWNQDQINWETPDIWINSDANDVNGVETYMYTDSVGNPIGNGDPPFVGAQNTVFARITNSGFADADDVSVEISWAMPIGAGDGSSRFTVIGMQIVDIPAGTSKIVSAELPELPDDTKVTDHGCIKVTISPQPNEISHDNNFAQENVNEFRTSRNSPWASRETTMRVWNPSAEAVAVSMVIHDLPEGWAYAVTPTEFDLPVGGYQDVNVRFDVAGTISKPSTGYDEGELYHVGVVPIAEGKSSGDKHLLGGVRFTTRLVFDTTTTLTLEDMGSGSVSLRACVSSPAQGAISFQVESPDGTNYSVVDTTDGSGCALSSFTTKPGAWSFRDLFAGTLLYGGSKSSPLIVNVP